MSRRHNATILPPIQRATGDAADDDGATAQDTTTRREENPNIAPA